MRAFLRSHTDFLERFVMEEVELEILERWMIRRMQRAKKRLDPPSTGRYSNEPSFATASLKYFCVNSEEKCQRIFRRPTFFFFYWRYNPLWVCILQPSSGAIASSCTRFLDYTQRCATVGRTPLDE